MTVKAPSQRTKAEKQMHLTVSTAYTDAMAEMCERVYRQAVQNKWPKHYVREVIAHHGGGYALEFWDEWVDS